MALLAQRFEAKALVSAGAAFMTTCSIGAVCGPPVVGALMDAFGARSLPLVLGGVAAIVAFSALAARSEWKHRPVSTVSGADQA
jgi:MFS family permease